MSSLKATSAPFVPGKNFKGFQAGPPGKETTYYTADAYKNKKTGQEFVLDNLDKKSPRPDPSKLELLPRINKGTSRGGKSKKRRLSKKKRSTRKH